MRKLRIALLGLGDIAKKAYLPITASHDGIEPILCSRNSIVLNELKQKYRINETYQNLTDLIDSQPDAIMVHSATDSHFSIAKQCLAAGIATFVDKPISISFAECQTLVDLAEMQNVPLYVGFNRPKAPLVSKLTAHNLHHVIWQKNRVNLPSSARDFIFNDFIHVVDGLLFLANRPQIEQLENFHVTTHIEDNLLTRIHFSFTYQQTLFEGSMNRLSGVTEERIEVYSVNEKIQINSLTSGQHYRSGKYTPLSFNDWQSNLYQRGFNDMIEDWLTEVKSKKVNLAKLQAILNSHRLCETLIEKIS